MTTPDTVSKQPKTGERFRLPDPPEREPDEKMSSVKHLHQPGNTHHLAQHIGNPERNIVSAELYITMMPERRLPSGLARRYPDLLIALEVDPEAYYQRNGYVIQEQGKPPDFVLEVASPSTAEEDTGPKRLDYEALGIAEYWRFDETGEHHGERLGGDLLVEGRYEPIEIEELEGGVLQGYSAALNLFIRWELGQLRWHDPATGRHILTYEDQRARAEAERARVEAERTRADTERIRADTERIRAESEREARLAAEARVRELEERLAQQNP